MQKPDLIKQILVSLSRLSIYYSEDTKVFLWELSESQLNLILKFTALLQKFYRRGK